MKVADIGFSFRYWNERGLLLHSYGSIAMDLHPQASSSWLLCGDITQWNDSATPER
jgi:hypothetical protein